jgi:hypothetical protein
LFFCVHKLAVVLRTRYSMFGFRFDCFFTEGFVRYLSGM